MSGSTNGNVPLAAVGTHSVEYGGFFLLDDHAGAGEVQVRAETEESATYSQEPARNRGIRIPSLRSIDVQEVVPLVTDVQLEECPVSSSSVQDEDHRMLEASLVLQQPPHLKLRRERSFSVTTSENSEQDAQEGDHADITPCAIACASTGWAGAGSPSNVETTTVVAYNSHRPAIIFASAIKPTPDSFVGLHFRARREGGVYISRIADDSLFCDCNFKVGDLVVAVNNISCMDAKRATPVVKLLHKISSMPTEKYGSSSQQQDPTSSLQARTVSICVHNQQGDPRIVSTSIQKPHRLTPVGVYLVNTQRRSGDDGGGRGSSTLTVTRISADSLFAGSLLLPRQRCRYMNGVPCDHWSAQEAVQFIRDVPNNRVTIISEPPPASSSSYHQQPGAAVAAAMVISASQRQQPQPQHEPKLGRQLTEKLWSNAKQKLRMPARRPVSASSQRNIPRVTAC
jgi:hypothetical protein